MTTTAEAYTAIVDKVWTCLGCGDVLPPHRGGHCDACVEWRDDTPHPAPPDPDPPDPLPPLPNMRANPDDDSPPIGPDPEQRCRNCGGAHHIQECSEILDAFPNPGRAIARHWHTRPKHFIQTLQQFDRTIWPVLAIPCAVYEGWTVRRMLDTWTKAADGDVHLPANAREAA